MKQLFPILYQNITAPISTNLEKKTKARSEHRDKEENAMILVTVSQAIKCTRWTRIESHLQDTLELIVPQVLKEKCVIIYLWIWARDIHNNIYKRTNLYIVTGGKGWNGGAVPEKPLMIPCGKAGKAWDRLNPGPIPSPVALLLRGWRS